ASFPARDRADDARLVRDFERDERLADRDALAGRGMELDDAPADRGGQLDGGLLCLDLRERRVALDIVPFGHVPLEHLRVDEPLAEIGQREHEPAHAASVRWTASRIRSGLGRYSSSSAAHGYGMSGPATRATGAFSRPKQRSMS